MKLGKKQPPAVIGTQKLGAKIGADWGNFGGVCPTLGQKLNLKSILGGWGLIFGAREQIFAGHSKY